MVKAHANSFLFLLLEVNSKFLKQNCAGKVLSMRKAASSACTTGGGSLPSSGFQDLSLLPAVEHSGQDLSRART